MELELIDNRYFIPFVSKYDSNKYDDYEKLIKYFKDVDKRIYAQFSFFHCLFYEYEEFPEYFFIIKKITTRLYQSFDPKVPEAERKIPRSVLKIDWADLCTRLNLSASSDKLKTIKVGHFFEILD